MGNLLVENAILEAEIEESDRSIAKRIGVSNRTVSQKRKELERSGRILPRIVGTHSLSALPARSVYVRDLASAGK